MAEKNLVNETLLQIQNLEEVINENAKEILASTMKEEISELVKESMKEETDEEVEMKEAEEDELETEVEFEDEEESEEEESEEDEEYEEEDDEMPGMMGMDDEMSDMMDMDDEPVADLTGEEDFEEVFKVFKNMKNSDTVTVVPDGDYTKISDDETEAEYLLQMEGEEEEEEDDETEEGYQAMEEEMYEDASYQPEEEKEEVMYEIEIDDTPADELEEEEYEFELEEGSYEDAEDNESYKPMMEAKKAKKMETKEGMKPKVGSKGKTGKPTFSYEKSKGGFNEKKKQGKTVGLGKGPKFEFKEGEVMEMPSKTKKFSKGEAKEASRTYGMGSKSGRGLRKGITPNRNYEYGKNVAESVEVMEELQMLRTKNEEYRKALNLFRDKLNEVAIFNSNLAYATRLFTEHSTSKHEKINILRRFDSAETLKESKALYKTIKDELSQATKATPITESIERVIDREPQSGSAINLIESKTYENPQFLRMKDIMSKIAK
jgi:hypothetical protein